MTSMKTNDNFRSDLLLKNVISAVKRGYIKDDNAMFLIGMAASRNDSAAKALLERCREIGVEAAVKLVG